MSHSSVFSSISDSSRLIVSHCAVMVDRLKVPVDGSTFLKDAQNATLETQKLFRIVNSYETKFVTEKQEILKSVESLRSTVANFITELGLLCKELQSRSPDEKAQLINKLRSDLSLAVQAVGKSTQQLLSLENNITTQPIVRNNSAPKVVVSPRSPDNLSNNNDQPQLASSQPPSQPQPHSQPHPQPPQPHPQPHLHHAMLKRNSPEVFIDLFITKSYLASFSFTSKFKRSYFPS